MPGPSQRPVCANLRAPVAPAPLTPGQPRVWSWNLAQRLWGGFGLAPPVGSGYPGGQMPQGRTAGAGSSCHLRRHTPSFPHLFTKNIFLMPGLGSARLDRHF